MRSRFVLLISLALVAAGCGGSTETTSEPTSTTTVAAVTTTMPSVSEPAAAAALAAGIAAMVPANCPGAIVRLDLSGSTVVDLAVGEVAFDSGRALTPQHPFHIASTTKLITAATVLRLDEQGLLGIEDLIADYLPADLVADLHGVEGVSRGGEITIRHLLGHTSGLADHVFDAPFVDEVLADPSRVWQPRDLVEYGIAHTTPLFAPGEGWHYSDTGFVLLGMIIESATGQPLHQAYRQQVLDRLGMDDAYLEGHEAARGLELTHPYIGDIDGTTIDPSTEWGGGGLVSTSADLALLGTAMLDGTLFDHAETLEEMIRDPGTGYGLGIFVGTGFGATILGHSGFWGSDLVVVPEWELVLVLSINQAEADLDAFTVGVLGLAGQVLGLPGAG